MARADSSDTVGFISDLPTMLVAAFRATLEEVIEADVLHVRDMAHEDTAAQAHDVAEVLSDLGFDERRSRIIEVWNKADLVQGERLTVLQELAARQAAAVVSAVRGGARGPSGRRSIGAGQKVLEPLPRHRRDDRGALPCRQLLQHRQTLALHQIGLVPHLDYAAAAFLVEAEIGQHARDILGLGGGLLMGDVAHMQHDFRLDDLLERRPERRHEHRRQIRDEADRVREY